MAAPLDIARDAFRDRAWSRAFDAYAQADGSAPLTDPGDLDRFAVTAFMLARLPEYFDIREREHQARLAANDVRGAARTAMWIGTQRMIAGQRGTGAGWIGRAGRLLADEGDCPERGWVLLAESFGARIQHGAAAAVRIADEAVAIAQRFGDDDLAALALHQKGLFLVADGEADRGVAALDEAMVGVTAGTVSPMVSGIVYCGVITGCWRVYDLGRAQEWTDSMSDWCAAQPEMRNFTGECRLRRAQMRELQGRWTQARQDAAEVNEEFDPESAAAAAYVRGNLDRLAGDWPAAEEEFREAARLGLEPQPGLALLRLAQGSVQAAAAMVSRADAEIHDAARRVELLLATTEILLAADDEAGAAKAADELAGLGARNEVIGALACHARALVDLRAGRAELALSPLRSALRTWLRAQAPYAEARIRVLLAQGYEQLADTESAVREREVARGLFEGLGAEADLLLLGRPIGAGGLTAREVQVLRMVAAGRTNRSIAAELVLSERTVDRHVSNILGKLGVSSRAAATAMAIERQLI